jgi:hypothetical protein
MLPAHAVTLAEARSHVAALADHAETTETSSAYEHVLLQLDWIHEDDVPALDTFGLTDDRDTLLVVATSAIEALVSHGVDVLQIELVLAMLDDARALDES